MIYRSDAELPENALTVLAPATATPEEVLIEDDRGNLSPTGQVEQKLLQALQVSSVPLSRLQKLYRPGAR